MSRISYSDDEERPGQFALWRANVNRSLLSRRGLDSLRTLEAELLAMPTKRLISNYLAKDGDVCTVGAIVLHRRAEVLGSRDTALVAMAAEEWERMVCSCWHGREHHAEKTGTCKVCANYVADQMDLPEARRWAKPCEAFHVDEHDEPDDEGDTEEAGVKVGVPRLVAWRLVELNDMDLEGYAPEERYVAVLKWVQSQLRRAETPEGRKAVMAEAMP